MIAATWYPSTMIKITDILLVPDERDFFILNLNYRKKLLYVRCVVI